MSRFTILSASALSLSIMTQLAWANICLLPPDPGPCDGICPRYYFNPDSGQCELFEWGCCDGNANNFPTLAECEDACLPYNDQSVPTVSGWGMLVLVLGVLTGASLVFRRHRLGQAGTR